MLCKQEAEALLFAGDLLKYKIVCAGLLAHIFRVKSGNFGHQVNSDSNHVCFMF